MRNSPIHSLPLLRAMVLLALTSAWLSAAEPQEVRVISWNVGGLSQAAERKAAHARRMFAQSSDVLVLQECELPEELAAGARGSDWFRASESSNVILARWPIIRSGVVAANPAWSRELPWADIQPPSGPVFRVYAVHLTFKRGGNPFLGEAREVEARRILIHARRFEGPVILAGDFNSLGWVLGGHASEAAIRLLLASGYADAFAGIGGRTSSLLGRLDWIFSSGFASAQPVLGDYDGSDHRWLLADLWIGRGGPATSRSASTVSLEDFWAAGLGLLAAAGLWQARRIRASHPANRQ